MEKDILVKNFLKLNKSDRYYVIISALTEFKRIEIAVSSFNNLDKNNLIII
jgi:hypothetical protein